MALKPKDVRVPPRATDTRLPLARLRSRGGAYRELNCTTDSRFSKCTSEDIRSCSMCILIALYLDEYIIFNALDQPF